MDKKSFLAGAIAGIVAIIATNMLYNTGMHLLTGISGNTIPVDRKIDHIFNILDEHTG